MEIETKKLWQNFLMILKHPGNNFLKKLILCSKNKHLKKKIKAHRISIDISKNEEQSWKFLH